MMMTIGQWVAAIHTIPSRVGAYVRSRMANQILHTISGIATVRRAPFDSIGLRKFTSRRRAAPGVVAIIMSSR
jgi:hypothetical protein